MSGVSLTVVQQFAGHKTLEMTRRYSHLAPEYQAQEVSKLDGWGPPSPTKLFPMFFELAGALTGRLWSRLLGGAYGKG
ncbi:hypothetical protein IV102_35535 [bacterium]|nr:hypothetical protein [bacterium]